MEYSRRPAYSPHTLWQNGQGGTYFCWAPHYYSSWPRLGSKEEDMMGLDMDKGMDNKAAAAAGSN